MIHRYKLGGMNIVLDICSGSVHLVDEVAYDMIGLFETESREAITAAMLEKYGDREDVTEADINECYEQIEELRDAGKLFTPDTFEPMAGALKAKSANVVKALCLHVAHTCNLNCSYCFASQGKYHGDRALMSFEVGKQALDFLLEHSGTRHNLEVDFFGGEPLMNFDVVKQLVAYARSREKECGKHFRFTLTTNGVLIDDDVIDFANREMSNVVLSLDGRKEVHDRYRVDYAGNGSWDRIVPKFQKLVKARGNKAYYMRGTFTHANPDFLKDIQQMLDLGFTELSMEPVVCAPGDPSALTDEDRVIVMEQYEKLAELMLERRRAGKPFILLTRPLLLQETLPIISIFSSFHLYDNAIISELFSSFNVIFLQILLIFLPILDIFHNFFVYFNIFDIMFIAFKSNSLKIITLRYGTIK